MTDLKNLLKEAAGEEPALTDQDLAADLRRGKLSARRRNVIGAVAGVAATALVITGGWSVLPSSDRSAPPSDPGVAATPSAKPSAKGSVSRPSSDVPMIPPEEMLPPAPAPDQPVELVRDGVVRNGTDLVCDLKPKGWKAKVWKGQGFNSELNFVHPTLHESGKYHARSTEIRIRHAGFTDGDNGEKWVEKYSNTWEELKDRHRKAGERTAVVSGPDTPPNNGLRDYHMRMSETKLIQVINGATALGWDLQTTLRFVGSCHYK